MAHKLKKFKNNGGEIELPKDYMDRIDQIVNKRIADYPSRDEFIRNAIEIKIAELRRTGPK